MKLYPLHIGDTKVPYGQFYGGVGDEWTGWRGMWRFLTDKSHAIMVPIYAYLVEHPEHGWVMIDTGINWQQAHAHRAYYASWLERAATDEDEYRLSPEQQLPEQLRRLGVEPTEVRTVVLTHLHEDHPGGVRLLPNTRFVTNRAEWNAKHLGLFAWNQSRSIRRILTDPDLVEFSSGRVESFDASHDLFGDGRIVLLPTPGHSVGHTSVLVRRDGHPILCTGDTLYTLRHLATDQVRALFLGEKQRRQQLDIIGRIRVLRETLPDLVITPAHDHTDYAQAHLSPALADGRLSAEEHQVFKAYEQAVLDGQRLRGGKAPRFVPPQAEEAAGSVSFA